MLVKVFGALARRRGLAWGAGMVGEEGSRCREEEVRQAQRDER